VDEKLSWKPQIKEQHSKVCTSSWAMHCLKNYVDLPTLRATYFALIYPTYSIASTAGEVHHNHLKPLIKCQKRCIRLLTGSGYIEHTSSLFHQSKCIKFLDIYKLETAQVLYRIYPKTIVVF